MRPWDWSFPPRELGHREVLREVPTTVDSTRPPLLFLHGTAHGAWCWQEHFLPAAAAEGWDSWAVSYRGHGGSGGHRTLRRSLTRDYVHDVLQTIAELPSPPILIGHSMGAIVAQLVADRYPLRGLVLLAPAPMHSALGALLAFARHRPLDALGVVGGRTLAMDPDLLFAKLPHEEAQRHSDRTGRESPWVQYEWLLPRSVGPVRAPVLVVGAGQDRLVRRRDVERTAAAYRVRPVWFAESGHDLMLDGDRAAVLQTVLDFAETVPAWGHATAR